MKRHIILAFLISTVVLSTAQAETKNTGTKMYFTGNIGFGTQRYKIEEKTVYGTSSEKKAGDGFVGTMALGYNLGNNLRTEVELYLDDGLPTRDVYLDLVPAILGFDATIDAEVRTQGLLLNAIYDFQNSSQYTPYVMMGVGYGHNKIKITGREMIFWMPYKYISESKNKDTFIWQIGTGVSYKINQYANLEVGLRIIDKGVNKLTFKTSSGSLQYKSKSLEYVGLVGVRIHL